METKGNEQKTYGNGLGVQFFQSREALLCGGSQTLEISLKISDTEEE